MIMMMMIMMSFTLFLLRADVVAIRETSHQADLLQLRLVQPALQLAQLRLLLLHLELQQRDGRAQHLRVIERDQRLRDVVGVEELRVAVQDQQPVDVRLDEGRGQKVGGRHVAVGKRRRIRVEEVEAGVDALFTFGHHAWRS